MLAVTAGTAAVVAAGAIVGIRLATHHGAAPEPPPAVTTAASPGTSPSPGESPSPSPSPSASASPSASPSESPSPSPSAASPSPSPSPSPRTAAPRVFPFHAEDGDRVAARLTGVTFEHGLQLEVEDASGAVVARHGVAPTGGFVDALRLPGAGDYVVRVSPLERGEHGRFEIEVIVVPPDVTAEILPNGPPVTVENTVPGQNMRLTFPGKAGQHVSLSETDIGVDEGVFLGIFGPRGGRLASGFASAPASFTDTITLPDDGTYTIAVSPELAQVGPVTLALHDVPGDEVVTTRPGSDPTTVTLDTPGQNAVIRFVGQAGQRVSMSLSDITVQERVLVEMIDSSATRLVSTFVPAPAGFVDAVTLPHDGPYAILVDPDRDHTGSVTLRLFDVPPDAAASVKVGETATVGTEVPGQNIRVQAFGSPGPVTLHVTGMTFSGLLVQQVDEQGTPVASSVFVASTGGDLALFIEANSVIVQLDPSGDEVGRVTFSFGSGSAGAAR